MGLNLIITESSVFFLQILREINHSYHTDENEIKWKWMISGSGSKKKTVAITFDTMNLAIITLLKRQSQTHWTMKILTDKREEKNN